MTKHPDEEIIAEYRKLMNDLATFLDDMFNGDSKEKKNCFVLLVAPFGDIGNTDDGRVNYISNGERKTVVTMLKEITARFEGQAEVKGKA
jgi:hypothetical protein